MKTKSITRRDALLSIATMSALAFTKPSSIFSWPVNDKLRFAVIGDWGTGGGDEAGIAQRMFASHQSSPLDFVISAGDNIYPNGSGRYFGKHFEQPFANLLRDRVQFFTVLG